MMIYFKQSIFSDICKHWQIHIYIYITCIHMRIVLRRNSYIKAASRERCRSESLQQEVDMRTGKGAEECMHWWVYFPSSNFRIQWMDVFGLSVTWLKKNACAALNAHLMDNVWFHGAVMGICLNHIHRYDISIHKSYINNNMWSTLI